MMRRFNPRTVREEGSAMILALLLLVIMMSIVGLLTTVVVVATQKSGSTRDFTYYSLAAETAISDAVSQSNQAPGALAAHLGKPNAVNGDLESESAGFGGSDLGIKWMWYAVDISASSGVGEVKSVYEVYAFGYRDAITDRETVELKVKLESISVMSANESDGGSIFYNLSPESMMESGFVGLDAVVVNDSAKVNSFNSSSTMNPTVSLNSARLGTNGVITFGNAAILTDIDMGYLYNTTSENPAKFKCIGPGGAACPMYASTASYGINAQAIRGYMNVACGTITPTANWQTSINGSVISASGNVLCLNDLILDGNTTLAGGNTTGIPLTVYVAGKISISPGVTVNNTSAGAYGPLALRILSTGNEILIRGGTSSPTKVTAAIVAPGAACNTSSIGSTAQVEFKGSMTCKTLALNGRTTMWYDQQIIQTLVDNSAGKQRIWSVTNYDNLS